MKNIKTAIQFIAVHLGLASSVALRPDREEHSVRRSRFPRWTAVLALLIALVAGPVVAQETNTITITGKFTSDTGEHTWSLAMHGTTHWHWYNALNGLFPADVRFFFTEVRATSFELRFSGPDADELNRVASEQLAGGSITLELRNSYQNVGGEWSTMALWIVSPDESASFWAGHEMLVNPGFFPSDAAGYPVVTPEPFPFFNEETYISWYGFFVEGDGLPNAEISGSMGSEVQPPILPPPPSVSIGDSSLVEGNRSSTQMKFTVIRSGSSEGAVSVGYRTVAGTALAKSDYDAAKGTLTFPPGVSSQTITIAVKSDRKREPDETFTVELFNAVGATVTDAVATGTILNDD